MLFFTNWTTRPLTLLSFLAWELRWDSAFHSCLIHSCIACMGRSCPPERVWCRTRVHQDVLGSTAGDCMSRFGARWGAPVAPSAPYLMAVHGYGSYSSSDLSNKWLKPFRSEQSEYMHETVSQATAALSLAHFCKPFFILKNLMLGGHCPPFETFVSS